ncbi:MAG TPA: energy transducer TonB [Terriglobales bacterium]|jgi:TonB family protein|nr:energy transducer TonB [Terriglobales bacterium]
MKKLVIAIAFFLCSFSPLVGATDPAAQQLLLMARRQASLHDQANPFEMGVDFVVQIAVPTQGHLTLKWAAKDRWWRKIVMGSFEEINIRNGERLYTSRNIGFTPVRIGELIDLLQFAENSEGLLVKKQKQRVENGIDVTCLKVEQENVKAKTHDVCVNSASHQILRDEWQEPPDERRKEQYSDYFDFAGHQYPRKLQLLVNGSVVITANVQDLKTTVFDQTLFLPQRGAIERRQCADMKHAVPIKTPDPVYPESASQNKLAGDTTVSMTVQADGSVTDIRLIGSATRSMDDATLLTLKGWKFRPAMCGSEPVVSDVNVVVSFRLH